MTKTQQILADWPCCLWDRASVKAEEGEAPNYQVCCFSPVPNQNNKIEKSKYQKLLTARMVRAAGQIPSRLNHSSSQPLRSESSMVREAMVQVSEEQFLGGRIFWETSLRCWSGLLVVVEIFWELVAPVVPEMLSSRFWRVISVQVISNKEEGQSHLGEANTCNRHIWPRKTFLLYSDTQTLFTCVTRNSSKSATMRNMRMSKSSLITNPLSSPHIANLKVEPLSWAQLSHQTFFL